jgi:hypothetical protein
MRLPAASQRMKRLPAAEHLKINAHVGQAGFIFVNVASQRCYRLLELLDFVRIGLRLRLGLS